MSEHIKGTFAWAMAQLNFGKRIRRAHWCKPFFLHKSWDGRILMMHSQNVFPLKYQSTQGKDWEIFEEPKEKPKDKWIIFCDKCHKTLDTEYVKDVVEYIRENKPT